MTPDINVLVAASRADHAHHRSAFTWLSAAVEACARGDGIEILPMVAAGFLRLVTNPKVFVEPTPAAAAVDFLESLLTVPGVEVAEIGREWPALKSLVIQHRLTANAIPDAWIASAAKTLGVRLVTFDRGFKRWMSRSELTVLEPA
jgi:toxin-antitoxin system PIN domain toxin